jgi:Prokaryotic homologs of the JAB domain
MREIEGDEWRPPPTKAYQLTAVQLRVPRRAMELTLELFRLVGRLECCCFWYGTRDDATLFSEVSAVVVPRQRQTWGNYHVPVESMRQIHDLIGSRGLRNLAQIHSHPGVSVEHSVYDDQMANSRRALSVVIPSYGNWFAAWPHGIGVHEFQEDYWYLLNDHDAGRRIVLTDIREVDFIDTR